MRSEPARRASRTRVLLVAGLLWTSALSGREVPYLAGRINDLADMLSPAVVARLEQELERLEQETGAQVAVLTVASLEGEPLEDYSLRVAETWELGRKEHDDGALLLIVRDERKMRLEVGYGLEPVLTDATSRRILDDVIRPRFRSGDFDGGVSAAVAAIGGLVRGEENVLPAPDGTSSQAPPLSARLFALLLFCVVVGTFSLGALTTPGWKGWFLYLLLLPFWYAFPGMILGPLLGWVVFVGWVVGFPVLWLLLRRARRAGRLRGRPWPKSGTTPWVWSSSGSGGGGFSGGFSGGGGSFGGGGASSGW